MTNEGPPGLSFFFCERGVWSSGAEGISRRLFSYEVNFVIDES